MSLLTTLFIALGLALDAFAMAITLGVTSSKPKLQDALTIAGFFGFFQAVMPLIGWSAGSLPENYIAAYDHWIAFTLLCLVGLHMIHESTREKSRGRDTGPLDIYVLLLLSLAESIDALAAGISFAFLDVAIVRTVLTIGCVAFSLSFVGYFIGDRMGRFFGKRVRVIGGIILIAIGVRILVEHLR